MRRLNWDFIGLVISIVVLIAIGGIAFFEFGKLALTIFSSIGSVILSLLLVYLYDNNRSYSRDNRVPAGRGTASSTC